MRVLFNVCCTWLSVVALLLYSNWVIASLARCVGVLCLGKKPRSLKEKLLRSRLTDLHLGRLVLA